VCNWLSAICYDHITPLLRQLHWLKAAERIDFKLAVLVYKCLHGAAPSYLADELCLSADLSPRRRLPSAPSSSLVVRRTRLSTIGDRAFPVSAANVWKGLPQHVTSASYLSAFRRHLKTHLFQHCFPWLLVSCLSSDFVIFEHVKSFVLLTYKVTIGRAGDVVCCSNFQEAVRVKCQFNVRAVQLVCTRVFVEPGYTCPNRVLLCLTIWSKNNNKPVWQVISMLRTRSYLRIPRIRFDTLFQAFRLIVSSYSSFKRQACQ